MTTTTITTDITDPKGTLISTGTLKFIAEVSQGTVLKGTYATTTPGTDIELLECTYKVYYTDANALEQYIGEIDVPTEDGEEHALITLLLA